MKKIFKIISWFGSALQALEFIGIFLFVLISPFIWMYWLTASHRFAQLSAVATFWILSLALVIYEMRFKETILISLGIFLTWLVVLGFVFSW